MAKKTGPIDIENIRRGSTWWDRLRWRLMGIGPVTVAVTRESQMDIREWPWKGKPVTNTYAQSALTFTGVVAVWVLAMVYPAAVVPTLLVGIGVLLFYAARTVWRDIRKEWRDPRGP